VITDELTIGTDALERGLRAGTFDSLTENSDKQRKHRWLGSYRCQKRKGAKDDDMKGGRKWKRRTRTKTKGIAPSSPVQRTSGVSCDQQPRQYGLVLGTTSYLHVVVKKKWWARERTETTKSARSCHAVSYPQQRYYNTV